MPTKTVMCAPCHGTGKVHGTTCPHCGGKGQRTYEVVQR